MIRRIIFWICLTASAIVFLKPAFMDALSSVKQTNMISGYETSVEAAGDDMDGMLKEAKDYNEELSQTRQSSAFTYLGEEATDEEYERILSYGDGTMASISYPALGIYLPVLHGTKSPELEYAAGHMYGTSLPVGGASTHSVIAAHTGLPGASLFTPLAKAKIGDMFYINLLNTKLAYQVDKIEVVLPEDEDAYLQIEDGEDFVTLYTCTPYGINDHRLLVRGCRTYPEEADISFGTMTIEKMNKAAVAGAATAAVSPVVLAIAGVTDCVRLARLRSQKRMKSRYRIQGFSERESLKAGMTKQK